MTPFSNRKCLNLETYRKDGTHVRTPVWFVEESGLQYVYTDRTTGKIKRIRRNPKVRVAPCDFGGNLKGDWQDGEAKVLEDSETPRIMRLFKKKYGIQIRLLGVYNALYRFFTRRKDETVIIALEIKPQT